MKSNLKKPVYFLRWKRGAVFGDMKFVQEQGAAQIEVANAKKEAEKAEFAESHPEGGSDVIYLINRIPIEQVVSQLLQCAPKGKRDGGMRFIDGEGKERGFFKHHEYNVIVHEGTSLFPPPSGVGYNCLGLVKAVMGFGAKEAIAWFAERSGPVREAQAAERSAWIKEHAAKEVAFIDSYFSNLP